MTEHRFYPPGAVPFVSTAEFHRDRERAPHLEQGPHQGRLSTAIEFVRQALDAVPFRTVSDLGCGDGGLLSVVQRFRDTTAWGYDFSPASMDGWEERGVSAEALDVFGRDWAQVDLGAVVVMTEVLEHLDNPHEVLRKIRWDPYPRAIVASSPVGETPDNHMAEHVWGWDVPDFAAMFEATGWHVTQHQQVDIFQVVTAWRRQ